MNNKFDPSKLVPIIANRRKSEPFDLRYTKGKKFQLSSDVWSKFDMNSNGVSMFKYPGGGVVISIQPEETSQALKIRKGSESKGTQFTSSELASLLDLGDKQADFTLTLMSTVDEVSYLSISPFTTKSFNSAPAAKEEAEEVIEETNQVEEVVSETTEEAEEVDQSTELDSDAFTKADAEEETAETEAETVSDPLDFI